MCRIALAVPTAALTRLRRGERGSGRGCLLAALTLLLGVVGFGAFLVVRLTTVPDLGPAPTGPSHGSDLPSLGRALAASAALQLVTQPHARLLLTESDLTLVVRSRNPSPQRFRDPEARVRNGTIMLAATTTAGPLVLTVSADATVHVDPTTAGPDITARVTRLDVGTLSVPHWMWGVLDARATRTLSLDPLLDSNAALRLARANLDCVGIAPAGVILGLHRPGQAADPTVCN